jgi:josephin
MADGSAGAGGLGGAAVADECGGSGDSVKAGGGAPLHWETQSWMLCGLHAANAILQEGDLVTREEMDRIADELLSSARAVPGSLGTIEAALAHTPFELLAHPYRGLFGNYDISVVLQALERRGLRTAWRKKGRDWDLSDDVVGFLVNSRGRHFGFAIGRHWWALRKVGGTWWNLDSKLARPERLGDAAACAALLDTASSEDGGEVIAVLCPKPSSA